MSRCLQEWGCLPRSRPKLLMTGSNWEVEDGAEPSLVNNSSGTFLFFGQLSIRLVDRPTAGSPRAGSSHPATAQKALVWVLPVTPFGSHCEQG